MPIKRAKYHGVNGQPNRQPFVMLACKDIVLAWPVITTLGGRKPETICDEHGWQFIKGLPTLMELIDRTEPDNNERLF